MKTTKLFSAFFESEKSSGLVLIACTAISLLLTNVWIGKNYLDFWQISWQGETIEYWINDGLMTIFFLLIGLELEREVYLGELSNIKTALFPFLASVGGMLVPAGIYWCFNSGSNTLSGVGIPMATDIAFALGILSLLGKKIPVSLKIFLTALAVIDDLGAILVIALFYTKTLNWDYLSLALGIFCLLLFFNRLKIRNLIPYLTLGVCMWYCMLHSGVHATITGVLLAFAIPFGNGNKKSTSFILQNFLHKPVAFVILPVFALANTAIVLNSSMGAAVTQNYGLGIAAGLIIGKPLGIFGLGFLAVKLKICELPNDLNWKSILAVGFLGGIGFTMSIFVSLLAFGDLDIINNAKFTILFSSLISGTIGYLSLKFVLKTKTDRLHS